MSSEEVIIPPKSRRVPNPEGPPPPPPDAIPDPVPNVIGTRRPSQPTKRKETIMNRFIAAITYPFVLVYRWIVGIVWRLFPSVELDLSSRPYFVGAYEEIKVRTQGIGLDDLEFVITEGAPGGYVSPCRDAEFDPANPSIMLCFGYKPGVYHIEAHKKSDGSLLRTFEFKLDTVWTDSINGPPSSFHGINGGYAVGATWGGGVAGQPQNLNVVPATGTRKVALLLVDTASQRYTTVAADLQAIKDKWLQNFKNGLVGSDGVARSSQKYYREASFNGFDIDCDLFGPVHLSGDFDSYIDEKQAPKNGFDQACITAGDSTTPGDGLIDYNQYQSVIFVMEPWNTTDAAGNAIEKSPWPQAWGGTYSSSKGSKSLGVIQMPHNWALKPIYATIAHELGHNLGLGDQYGNDKLYSTPINDRTLGNWELMAWENLIPQFTIAHRLMLGWIKPEWMKLYNFAEGAPPPPVNETITLNAIENCPLPGGSFPAGRFAGIEVRIADGRNYYVEYRKGQAPEISDKSLPTDSAALVTDVISSGYPTPIDRPGLLKVPNDPDGDGSVLVNGLDYEETDMTNGLTYPVPFRIVVNGIDGTKANVTIQYGTNNRPDPSIRPWPAGPDRPYQSPDIEVQNARNMADPTWFNVPWAGHANTVIARIKNAGSLNAPKVRAEFYVKDNTVGGAPDTFLDDVTLDVNVGDTVPFTTPDSWIPPSEGHFCISVRIPLYQLPSNPAVVEMTELNNFAQSNYDRFISKTASSASREISHLTIGNPYPLPTRIYIFPNQTNPLYRTYLEHTSVCLNPGETRKVKVMFEYDPQLIFRIPVSVGDRTIDDSNRYLGEKIASDFRRKPNHARFAGFIENPFDPHRHVKEFFGGTEMEIVTGKKTSFEYFYKDGSIVGGAVVTEDNKQRLSSGKVIIIFRMTDGKKVYEDYKTVPLSSQGDFAYKAEDLKDKLLTVQGYYLPTEGFGDCYSEMIG